MPGKNDHLVVKAQLMEELVFHEVKRAQREIGPLYNFMEDCLVPGADICIHAREVKQVPSDYQTHVVPHKHEVSSVYSIFGDLTVEIILEEEKHQITGPASVFIPAGMTHAVRPVKGTGYLVMVIKSGKYE
jgi:2-isopropylmalate synthase